MSYTTDNRWIRGQAPDDAKAAYGARWIDQGDWAQYDVVPDRQGFAYNDTGDRERLIDYLIDRELRAMNDIDRSDDWQRVVDGDQFVVVMRRSGGYCYVEAWLP